MRSRETRCSSSSDTIMGDVLHGDVLLLDEQEERIESMEEHEVVDDVEPALKGKGN